MTKPHVSVLIDTYNHERFIERAIGRMLEQDVLLPDGVASIAGPYHAEPDERGRQT